MRLDDKWLDKIAQKMDSYEEQAPAPDWGLIHAELNKVEKATPSRVTPMMPQRKWWALAAALFIGVLSYSVYMMTQTSDSGIDSVKVVAEDSYLKTILPQIQRIGKSNEDLRNLAKDMRLDGAKKQLESAKSGAGLGTTYLAYQDEEVQKIAEVDEVRELLMGENNPKELTEDFIGEKNETEVTGIKSEADFKVEEKQEYDDLYGHVDYSSFLKKEGNYPAQQNGLGVAMGSGGAFNLSGVSADQTVKVMQEVNIENFTAGSPGSMQKVKIQNGIPYTEKEIKQKEYDHNQPLSFGLSYRKPLTTNLSLESGLIYTYLSSNVKDLKSSTPRSYKQKLHYLGVPVKLNWNFYTYNRFSFYASAGGAVEFGISGKIDGQSKRPTRPQFSAQGGLGAQIAISKHVGLYFEPGVAYYFNDGSKLETIRKEKPFNFNLSTGLRLTF